MSVDNSNSTTPESEKDLAQTPWWLINSVESFIGGKFDIDVCCLYETKKAPYYISLVDGDDAMLKDWRGHDSEGFDLERSLAWCNPPFSSVMPFIERAVEQAELFSTTTVMIIPNNSEVTYRRKLKEVCDTFIEMPFRLQFLRPDGTPFLDKKGKPQGPKFSCAIGIITPIGLKVPSRVIEHDFRVGFYGK